MLRDSVGGFGGRFRFSTRTAPKTARRVWAIGMFGRMQWQRRLFGVALAAAVEGVAVLAFTAAGPALAQAQSSDQYQFMRRQYQRQQQGGGFFGLFGGWGHQPARRYRSQSEPQHHVDYSRAPAPRKEETQPDPNKPITSVVVMGGSMADWLAYGLEDAFSDSPNVEIVRKDKAYSGLLRYQAKSDLDWWHVARDDLAQQKANYVVMMLGINDRQNIRESDVTKEAEQEAAKNAEKNAASQPDAAGAAKTDQADAAKDKPKPAHAKGVIEFRSDQWEKVYTRRIDKTIAALKSRGVPVFWVGLPSIRGTKSTADAVYLNNLYRARAQRAGIVYIDVWDGFVDDAGKYSSYGPDYEGQTRRLRSGDGVFFTKYGARKLAHYVEREIRRYMTNRVTTLTLPTGPFGPTPGGAKSTVRPLAGPVLPLTAITGNTDVLLGGADTPPARADQTASGVLVKGDAVSAPPGRADDFKWPPDSQDYGKPPEPPAAANKPAKIGPAANAPAPPQTQASVPPAAVQPAPAPDAAQAAAAEKAAAEAAKAEAEARAKAEAEARAKTEAKANEAQAKKQAEEKAQAEARRRAAERSRAEARRGLRPPAGIDTRRQQAQRRPQRRSNDPISELFGLAR
jgi:uncharacterized protein